MPPPSAVAAAAAWTDFGCVVRAIQQDERAKKLLPSEEGTGDNLCPICFGPQQDVVSSPIFFIIIYWVDLQSTQSILLSSLVIIDHVISASRDN